MSTYIVTWNPKSEGWNEYEDDLDVHASGGRVERNWSFRNQSVEVGDRIFMLRQREERGIVASGHVVRKPFVQEHWHPNAETQSTTYVPIEFDMILAVDNRLSVEQLANEIPNQNWNQFYFSGQLLPSPADSELEQLWTAHLNRIGIHPPNINLPRWTIEPGEIVTRGVVAERYGGATQGGIQPSAITPNIMIYSDPSVGHSHGYNYDGPADGAYYYTGEGQVGDQVFRAGNRAIRDHAADGRILRLFEAAGPTRPGGKPQRYLGAYAIDPHAPYRYEPAPDRNGNTRQVIVFRLLTAGPSVDTNLTAAATAPLNPTSVELVPVEANTVKQFEVAATDSREAQRWESSLMRQLETYLSSLNHTVQRVAIRPAGETIRLLTDTYDSTTAELFEIKPDASRAHVAAAVAQLLDYRRHLPDLQRATVLLPRTPSSDLQDYVAATGLGLAVFHDGQLTRIA